MGRSNLLSSSSTPTYQINFYYVIKYDHRPVSFEFGARLITEATNKVIRKDYERDNQPEFRKEVNKTIKMIRDLQTKETLEQTEANNT